MIKKKLKYFTRKSGKWTKANELQVWLNFLKSCRENFCHWFFLQQIYVMFGGGGRKFGLNNSRMDQLKIFKSCLSQILLGPFLNTLSHLNIHTCISPEWISSKKGICYIYFYCIWCPFTIKTLFPSDICILD